MPPIPGTLILSRKQARCSHLRNPLPHNQLLPASKIRLLLSPLLFSLSLLVCVLKKKKKSLSCYFTAICGGNKIDCLCLTNYHYLIFKSSFLHICVFFTVSTILLSNQNINILVKELKEMTL